MRRFPFLLIPLLASISMAESRTEVTRPNIVLMMADDMGMGDTSAYQDFTGNRDSEQIHTPNMERLARMGVRFTDAHTPSSRCSPTRYALLTGRYPWRNRLKHWVLFGAQGDPMIEADRPTIATLLQQHGYRTAMVGKWHVGLRYRRRDGGPADGWDDADLTQPMVDTPIDHGFDYCRFTSRSHGTSGPSAIGKNRSKRNGPAQTVGPGHIHGRTVVGATGNGKELVAEGEDAYVLSKLGSRHLNHATAFLDDHLGGDVTSKRPFFLYYPSNSNHGPYTPDSVIGEIPIAGAAKNVAGQPMDVRSDYIYENDVVLGQLIDYLQRSDDPRRRGHKLIDNTIVIFTSDNGAEKDDPVATGPFRSNKGSAYEGGHRVPFIVCWPLGQVGDGDDQSPGPSGASLMGLQDLYATFADILGAELPNARAGEKGAEDSFSVLEAWRGNRIGHRPMFFNDHKQADDPAAVAMRLDDPVIDEQTASGQWKIFFDARLLRAGVAHATELFDLSTDPKETTNLLGSANEKLVEHLVSTAIQHRTAGHRLVRHASGRRIKLDWLPPTVPPEPGVTRVGMRETTTRADGAEVSVDLPCPDVPDLVASISAVNRDASAAEGFNVNPRGLGVDGGSVGQVDSSEVILVQFNHDVLVESAAIVAGNGVCGGFYRVGDGAPLAIYCVDADLDAKDQSGVLSDIGVLKRGQALRLSSAPHHGVEKPGSWRLASLTLQPLIVE